MNVLSQHATLTITAQVSELRRAAAWLQAESGARAVPPDELDRLDLCLHEALANVLDHADLPADAPLELLLHVHSGCAVLTVIDGGRPYDPTAAAAPERPATLADTLPGGLGVVMLRSHSDQLDYEYRDGRNRLGITVRWSAA